LAPAGIGAVPATRSARNGCKLLFRLVRFATAEESRFVAFYTDVYSHSQPESYRLDQTRQATRDWQLFKKSTPYGYCFIRK